MLTLSEVADITAGKLTGEPGIYIYRVSDLSEAKEGDISFVSEKKFIKPAEDSKASAFIVKEGLTLAGRNIVTVPNPHYAVAKIMEKLYIKEEPIKGVHPSALVSEKSKLGENISIMPYVVIESGAEIGDNAVIYPFTYIGKNTVIGASTVVYPNVVVREDVIIGNHVIIHSGAVIGSDGFGYTKKEDHSFYKIPQVGKIVIEDHVEIGANVCIDRAMLFETRIKQGTKIDNLVQVAHNVNIGENCIVAAQSGIAGSAKLSKGVILAGQVGVADHVHIGENAFILSQSGVSKDLEGNKVYVGSPAEEARQAWKTMAEVKRLSDLSSKIKILQQHLKDIDEYLKAQVKK